MPILVLADIQTSSGSIRTFVGSEVQPEPERARAVPRRRGSTEEPLSVHIQPTVTELIPTMLGELEPMQ